MWSSDSDREDEPAVSSPTTATTTTTTTSSSSSCPSSPFDPPPHPRRRRQRRARRPRAHRRHSNTETGGERQEPASDEAEEAEDVWRGLQQRASAGAGWPRRASRPVVVAAGEDTPLDGASGAGEGGMGRARSLTDDDLEELKGCVDLGFGFSYHEIPELCGTLPALELCYSMSQRFLLDDHQPSKEADEAAAAKPATAPASPAQPGATNWKISSPGDSPDEVKARLKYWAQAVACTVKLCS